MAVIKILVMLSLIICSKHSIPNEELIRNIEETVGVDYEIIHIDNSRQEYSIFQAYNKGVKQAHGDYLCFMHEDIAFHSVNWGQTVIQQLNDQNVGLVGVAGAKMVPANGDWRFYGNSYVYIIQGHHTLGELPLYYVHGIEWNTHQTCQQASIVDGCWFCIRKELFSEGKLNFDEEHFSSFHLYDSDISMQVNQLGLKILLCTNILIEHFSVGLYSQDFLKGLQTFTEKWKDSLPYSYDDRFLESSAVKEKLAAKRLARRIEDDKLVSAISNYYQMKAKGKNVEPLPKDAERLIEDSYYRYTKEGIKYAQTNREGRRVLRLYLDKGFKTHSKTLIMKYLYYRFGHRKKNQIVHVKSLNPEVIGI